MNNLLSRPKHELGGGFGAKWHRLILGKGFKYKKELVQEVTVTEGQKTRTEPLYRHILYSILENGQENDFLKLEDREVPKKDGSGNWVSKKVKSYDPATNTVFFESGKYDPIEFYIGTIANDLQKEYDENWAVYYTVLKHIHESMVKNGFYDMDTPLPADIMDKVPKKEAGVQQVTTVGSSDSFGKFSSFDENSAGSSLEGRREGNSEPSF